MRDIRKQNWKHSKVPFKSACPLMHLSITQTLVMGCKGATRRPGPRQHSDRPTAAGLRGTAAGPQHQQCPARSPIKLAP